MQYFEARAMAKANERYPDDEARRRFEAALRGARIAGPQHAKSVTPKKGKAQRKKRAKKRS
jgi:hypothetical protein